MSDHVALNHVAAIPAPLVCELFKIFAIVVETHLELFDR